jgi:hypothetical protein
MHRASLPFCCCCIDLAKSPQNILTTVAARTDGTAVTSPFKCSARLLASLTHTSTHTAHTAFKAHSFTTQLATQKTGHVAITHKHHHKKLQTPHQHTETSPTPYRPCLPVLQRQRGIAGMGLPSSSNLVWVGGRRWRLTGVSMGLPASSNLKWRPAGSSSRGSSRCRHSSTAGVSRTARGTQKLGVLGCQDAKAVIDCGIGPLTCDTRPDGLREHPCRTLGSCIPPAASADACLSSAAVLLAYTSAAMLR